VQAIFTGFLFGYWPWLRVYTVFVMTIHSISMVILSFLVIYFIKPPPDLNCEEDVIETQIEMSPRLPQTPTKEETADKAECELLRVSASSPSGNLPSIMGGPDSPSGRSHLQSLEDSPSMTMNVDVEESNHEKEESHISIISK